MISELIDLLVLVGVGIIVVVGIGIAMQLLQQRDARRRDKEAQTREHDGGDI